MSWVTDAGCFGNGVAAPPLNIATGAVVLGLDDSGDIHLAYDEFMNKRSDIFTAMGLCLAQASFWPNNTMLKKLKADGPRKNTSLVGHPQILEFGDQ